MVGSHTLARLELEHRGDELGPVDQRHLQLLQGGRLAGRGHDAVVGDDAAEGALELAREGGPAAKVVGAREGALLLGGAQAQKDLHQLVAVEVAVRDLRAAAHALGLALERRHPDHHLQQHAPHPPLVHLGRVGVVAHQQLRRPVPQRDELAVHHHDVLPLLGEAKVAQLGGAVREHNHVARLDVLVHHPHRVDKVDGRNHVARPQLGVPEGETQALLLDDGVEVADGPLHDEHAAVLRGAEHLHDVLCRPQ
mmetsp:Transcript_18069/g.35299  ORF Transcript_18069/g.35299 Transcript_18069/m.35299 type:complete len:252 (-) Transcript_18069:561-1316(-)